MQEHYRPSLRYLADTICSHIHVEVIVIKFFTQRGDLAKSDVNSLFKQIINKTIMAELKNEIWNYRMQENHRSSLRYMPYTINSHIEEIVIQFFTQRGDLAKSNVNSLSLMTNL